MSNGFQLPQREHVRAAEQRRRRRQQERERHAVRKIGLDERRVIDLDQYRARVQRRAVELTLYTVAG